LVYYTQTGSPRHAYGVPRDDTNQTTLLSLLSNQEKDKLMSEKYKRYEFHESFCSDHECDCRKAMINVVNQNGERITTLSYCWEDIDYYLSQGFSEHSAKDMVGINFDMCASKPNQDAHEAKKMFEELVKDESYAKRIVKHYKAFKKALVDQDYYPDENSNKSDDSSFDSIIKQTILSMKSSQDKTISKLSRNDLCTCGSGKKYKKCCLNSSKEGGNNRYRKIPRFSTQEMADSEELALLAMPFELTFISLDRKYSINDLFIKNILEVLLDKYYYNEEPVSNYGAGATVIYSLFRGCIEETFKDEEPETIYKILATIYQCIMVRGYRGRAYIEFLHKFASTTLPLQKLAV